MKTCRTCGAVLPPAPGRAGGHNAALTGHCAACWRKLVLADPKAARRYLKQRRAAFAFED